MVWCVPTWIGHGASGGAISSLSPGPVPTKASLSQSSASPISWWRRLLWLTLIRVCSHLGVYALILPGDWPLRGPSSGMWTCRKSIMQRAGLCCSFSSSLICWMCPHCLSHGWSICPDLVRCLQDCWMQDKLVWHFGSYNIL